MIPIGDVNPRERFPIVTVGLIALNALVFAYQLTLSNPATRQFWMEYGLVPAQFTQNPGGNIDDVFTSMFLHGSLLHIGSNMLYLWIFGDNIEEVLRPIPFIVFYLVSGVAAALAQVAVAPGSELPTIGASGAVAGVLGAYIVLYPRARIRTVAFIFYFIRFFELPAMIVLGLWFVIQLFRGIASVGMAESAGGVAWFAHIGGFLLGLVVGLVVKEMMPSERQRGMPPRYG